MKITELQNLDQAELTERLKTETDQFYREAIDVLLTEQRLIETTKAIALRIDELLQQEEDRDATIAEASSIPEKTED